MIHGVAITGHVVRDVQILAQQKNLTLLFVQFETDRREVSVTQVQLPVQVCL